jgi:hypothetical protein
VWRARAYVGRHDEDPTAIQRRARSSRVLARRAIVQFPTPSAAAGLVSGHAGAQRHRNGPELTLNLCPVPMLSCSSSPHAGVTRTASRCGAPRRRCRTQVPPDRGLNKIDGPGRLKPQPLTPRSRAGRRVGALLDLPPRGLPVSAQGGCWPSPLRRRAREGACRARGGVVSRLIPAKHASSARRKPGARSPRGVIDARNDGGGRRAARQSRELRGKNGMSSCT